MRFHHVKIKRMTIYTMIPEGSLYKLRLFSTVHVLCICFKPGFVKQTINLGKYKFIDIISLTNLLISIPQYISKNRQFSLILVLAREYVEAYRYIFCNLKNSSLIFYLVHII